MSSISGLGASSLQSSLQQTTLSSATNLSVDGSSLSNAVSISLMHPVDRIVLSGATPSSASDASSTSPSGTEADESTELDPATAALQALLAKTYSGS